MTSGKESMQEMQVQSLGQKIPWRREWHPTPVFMPGKSHGQRSLVGCSARDGEEPGAAEPLSMRASQGERNRTHRLRYQSHHSPWECRVRAGPLTGHRTEPQLSKPLLLRAPDGCSCGSFISVSI